MAEKYREFDASDNIKTAEDAQGLLRAATEEDVGDGVVIRAALKHVARTHNMSASLVTPGSTGAISTRRSPKTATPPSQRYSRSPVPWG